MSGSVGGARAGVNARAVYRDTVSDLGVAVFVGCVGGRPDVKSATRIAPQQR